MIRLVAVVLVETGVFDPGIDWFSTTVKLR
jgi:hypothetical protein